MSDVNYNPGESSVDLPITDPIHAPCPDMAGMENPVPEKRENSLFRLDVLRQKHGIQKHTKPEPKPLNYTCTCQRCMEPWDKR